MATLLFAKVGSILGCEFEDQGRGLVSVYYDTLGDASDWTLVFFFQKLVDTNSGSRCGWATTLNLNGERLALSCPKERRGRRAKIGLIHIFDRTPGTTSLWYLQETLPGAQDLKQFGFSPALSALNSSVLAAGLLVSSQPDRPKAMARERFRLTDLSKMNGSRWATFEVPRMTIDLVVS